MFFNQRSWSYERGTSVVKILVINGSPMGSAGNTEVILQPFLRGAKNAGAQIDLVYLKDRIIEDCIACYVCWQKTFGICDQDDMPDLAEKVHQADAIVYATPLQGHSVFSIMKIFMDHSLDSTPITKQKVVLISDGDQPDRSSFDGLVETFKLVNREPYRKLTGTILCPMGLSGTLQANTRYIEACEMAGREFAMTGAFSPRTGEILESVFVGGN